MQAPQVEASTQPATWRRSLGHPRPLRRGPAQVAGVALALVVVAAFGAVEARTPPSVTVGGLLVGVVLVSTWLFSAPASALVSLAALAVPVVAYGVGSDDPAAAEIEVLAIIVISATVHVAVRAVEQYEGLLARHNAQLLEVNASLERFTADAAHEFRAPLAVVLSEADMALARATSPAEYRHHLERIRDEVTHMRRTITGLLTMARADAGVLQAAFRSVDLVDLLEELSARWRPLSAEHDVRLDTDLPDDGVIACDPDLVVRVVDNLLDNALRATPSGGTVTVAARRDAADWLLTVTNTAADTSATPLDDRTLLPASTAVRRREGGLGLALSAVIVQAHRGSISVDRGDGLTSFVVRLPAAAL